LNVTYHRAPEEITVDIESSERAELQFSPAVSLRAQVMTAEVNGHRVPFQMQNNEFDQHPELHASLFRGKNTVRLRLRSDFEIGYASSMPSLGSISHGLRVTSESWSASHDSLVLGLAGFAGSQYQLPLWNAGQIASVEGAVLKDGNLVIKFPSDTPEVYSQQTVTIHFASASGRR
jgi:hypothetical protein